MKQIVEHLQLMDQLPRKGKFDLLFNLGYINSNVLKILEFTHNATNRRVIEDNRLKVTVSNSSYPIIEVLRKLTHTGITGITIPSDMYYVIYKLNSEAVPQSMRENLQEALGYTIATTRVTMSAYTKECTLCGTTSSMDICWRCRNQLIGYTEFRRDNFEVPVTYLNFKKISEGSFSFLYKDWKITRDGEVILYELQDSLYDSLREDYSLPIVEYQKQIHR